ncbi:MAG: phosphatase PAP2 family protein [Bryobacteraceae bacterium]
MIDILFHAIRSVDVGVYQFLNAYAGNRILDLLAAFEEENSLLKGGLFLSLYAYFWFRNGPDRQDRRAIIIAAFAGTLLGVVVSRTIADVIPFRIRPMYEAGIIHHPHSFAITGNMERWSSFPSDTAAYFAAMAFGLARLLRRYGALLAVYTAVWICLPRLFLGEHYFSDIVVGSLVGMTMVWVLARSQAFRCTLAPFVLSFLEATPGLFYAAGFLVAFEMAVMFNDLRSAAHLLIHASFHLLPVAGALLVVVAIPAYAVVRAFGRRERHQLPPRTREYRPSMT